MELLRKKISSDIKDLNELHKKYWWIPDENMIRPSPKVLEDKRVFSEYVLANWMSFRDFILDTHFKYQVDVDDGHMYVLDITTVKWNFSQSIFPYDLPSGVNHYVLWNSLYDYGKEIDDLIVNLYIEEHLKKIVRSTEFDYVWYKNPKPSIPELWHCQVFWIIKA